MDRCNRIDVLLNQLSNAAAKDVKRLLSMLIINFKTGNQQPSIIARNACCKSGTGYALKALQKRIGKGDGAMRWLEIVTVRSAGGTQLFADSNFIPLIKEIKPGGGTRWPNTVIFYHHTINKTDLSVHFYYKTGPIEIQQSPLAWRLMEMLKPYGVVSHGIWIEQKRV